MGRATGRGTVPAGEEGAAIVEFVVLGVLLLVPVVYLLVTASQLQAAAYAAVGAADHAAKVFVAADSEQEGAAYAGDAVDRAVANLGIEPTRASMSYACSAPCLEPGSTVTVTVDVSVVLPLLPPGIDAPVGTSSSSATHRVDRFG